MKKNCFLSVRNSVIRSDKSQKPVSHPRVYGGRALSRGVLGGIAAILLNLSAAAASPCAFSNNQIDFTAKGEKLQLNYRLAGKSYPALMLLPQLKGSSDKAKYVISCAQSNKKSRVVRLQAPDGTSGSFMVTFGVPANTIKISQCQHIKSFRVAFNSKALVLPDDIGEHLLAYPNCCFSGKAGGGKSRQLMMPDDNYLVVNMLDSGNALLSCLWNNSQVKVTETAAADGSHFSGMTIFPKADTRIWFSVNAAQHIWYKVKAKLSRKPTVIKWLPPFKARWYVVLQKDNSNFPVENGQSDAWVMADFNTSLRPKVRGGVGFTNDEGRAWTSGLGVFTYPFFQRKKQVYLLFPKYRNQYHGYATQFMPLIFPLRSLRLSSVNLNLPCDIRDRVLDKEIVKNLYTVPTPKHRQPATCGTTYKVEKIFYRGQEKQKAAEIRERFRRMNIFVSYNRTRIEEYLSWSKKMLGEMKSYSRKHPQAAAEIKTLQSYIHNIIERYNRSREAMKTPAYCRKLTQQWIALIDSKLSDEEKEQRSKALGRQIRTIGGHQDELLGDMRDITKAFRLQVTQRLMCGQSAIAPEFLQKLRRQTAKIMHFRYGMEGK